MSDDMRTGLGQAVDALSLEVFRLQDAADDAIAERADLRTQLDAARAEVASLQNARDGLEMAARAWQGEVERLRVDAEVTGDVLARRREMVCELEAENARLRAAIAPTDFDAFERECFARMYPGRPHRDYHGEFMDGVEAALALIASRAEAPAADFPGLCAMAGPLPAAGQTALTLEEATAAEAKKP